MRAVKSARRSRPTSARSRPQSAIHGKTAPRKRRNNNATPASKKKPQIRPSTASSNSSHRRKTLQSTRRRRRTASSSTQQAYASLLERQALLYTKCIEMERKNKLLIEKQMKTKQTIETTRLSCATYANINFCNVRNAEAEKRRREGKTVAILEKQVLATKRRLSAWDSDTIRKKGNINNQRKRRMNQNANANDIETELIRLNKEIQTMLQTATTHSVDINQVQKEKMEHKTEVSNEENVHHDNVLFYQNETKFYIQKSQNNIKKDMEEMDQKMKDKDQQLIKEQEDRMHEMQNIKMHQHLELKKKNSNQPSHEELQIAFLHIEPHAPKRKDLHGHDVPISRKDLIDYVISKILHSDKQKFDLLEHIQTIANDTEKHQQQLFDYETKTKQLLHEHASKTTKTKTQFNFMNNVLNRIRTKSHQIGVKRIRTEQTVLLLLTRVKELLEQLSHPSVQKWIKGTIVNSGSGDGNNISATNSGVDGDGKNKDGKTSSQIKRDKRNVLITNLTVHSIVNGFRTMESDCLQIINQYLKKKNKGSLGSIKLPFGPKYSKGALLKSMEHSESYIKSTIKPHATKKHPTTIPGGNLGGRKSHEEKENAEGKDDIFMTREELMTRLNNNDGDESKKYLYRII